MVYSPVYLSEDVRQAVDDLGMVAYVVAPNKIHNLALAQWMESYPNARTYALPGPPLWRAAQAHGFAGVQDVHP